jgi:hypothetical protein
VDQQFHHPCAWNSGNVQLSPTPTVLQLFTSKVGFAPTHDSFDNFPWVDSSFFEGHVVTEVSGFLQKMAMSDAVHLLHPLSAEPSQTPFAYVMQRGNLYRDNSGFLHAGTSTAYLFFPSTASKRKNIELHHDIGKFFYQVYTKSHVVTQTMHPGYQAFRGLIGRGLDACFGKGNYAAKELLRPTLPTQGSFAGFHRPPSLVITVPINKLQEIVTQTGPASSNSSTSQPIVEQHTLGAIVMDSSEATISTQDHLATAAVQSLLQQQLALVRQDIQAEVTAQLRAVDSRISMVDSRISSVEEATSQTQRDVSRLESQSRDDGVRRDAQYQDLKEEARLQREQSASMQTQAASQAQFEALMSAMAALSSRVKDT